MEIVEIVEGRVTLTLPWDDALKIADALQCRPDHVDWRLMGAMASALEAAALAGYMQSTGEAEKLTLETMRESAERDQRLDLLRSVG